MRESGAIGFHEAISSNQQHWRESRGRFFRHPELKRLAHRLDRRFKEVFSGYIDPNFPPQIPVFTSSVVKYDGQFPYEHAEAFPDTVAPTDRDAYITGINLIDEWATNYATNYYLAHAGNSLSRHRFRRAYARYGDFITYGKEKKAYGKTYRIMHQIEKTAKRDGIDFNNAIFQGLFKHNFNAINQLIEQTESVSASTIEELAIALGKKNSTSHREEKQNTRRRNNDTIYGLYSAPGIVLQGTPNFIRDLGGISLFALTDHPYMAGFLAAIVAVAGPYAALSYIRIHELVHAYSASENYIGFGRADLLPRHETETPNR